MDICELADTRSLMICITGMDGSGKSALVRTLAEALRDRTKLKVATVSAWDMILNLPDGTHALQLSRQSFDDYVSLVEPNSRMILIQHFLMQACALARESKADIFLVDGYWYKYLASIVAQGGCREFLERSLKELPDPDVTFFLNLDPQLAMTRKPSFTGFETGYSTDRTEEEFVKFQTIAYKNLHELSLNRPWIHVDASMNSASVASFVLRHPAMIRCMRTLSPDFDPISH